MFVRLLFDTCVQDKAAVFVPPKENKKKRKSGEDEGQVRGVLELLRLLMEVVVEGGEEE